ncbi:MAG: transcriptional repressor [Oscillospiraceae bacterium]|jgi:Fur family ferric uptake transcriptional regulator|nr:transcriptional repressor [Oscillospiraceae bacterium]
MHRPERYSTKQGEAVLAYLASVKDVFVTAAQIADYLQKERVPISRPTVYRQLEKLVREGRLRKYLFGDTSVSSFQYIDPDESCQDSYHLKCEICDGIFNLECDEVDHVSRHIFESHAFRVNDSKTVFYGKCRTCQQE